MATLLGAELLADLQTACGREPGTVCELVHDWTDSDLAAKASEWAVEKPITILVILAVAWVLTRLAKRFIDGAIAELIARRETATTQNERDRLEKADFLPHRAAKRLEQLTQSSERSRQRAVTLNAVLKSLAAGTIWTLALLIALGEVGINLGPLIAGAGIAGVAIGFGAQSLVRDFLAGIFIIIEDQYGVGDVVDVGDAIGTVEAVSMRTTRVRDVHGVLWVVPNGEIRRVGNMSQLWARSVLDIGVAYDTDLDLAMETLKEVADVLWRENLEEATILEEPEVWGVQELGDSAISIRLAVKTDPAEQWATGRLLRKMIKDRFDEVGIEIPFPQTTVHLAHLDSPAPPARQDAGSGRGATSTETT
ncbi:MAG: mechanosensitive ion channel family protein [Actinobacteria bacterium]|nr:mechanosensitive ion channel family protein [Actinomycetota bacterium]